MVLIVSSFSCFAADESQQFASLCGVYSCHQITADDNMRGVQTIKEKIYTVAEAAEILALTEGRVRQLCRWNSIGVKLGRDWVLSDEDVQKLRDRDDRRKNSA